MPIDIQETTHIDRWEGVDPWSKSTPKDNKMYQSAFTKATVKYLLLHESGESQELVGYGHGVDPQDKGAGKATTYALKNCLLYTFLTPVGKIDDTETTHSEEIEAPQASKPEVKEDKRKTLIANSEPFHQAITRKIPIEQMKEHYFITEPVMKAYLKALEDGGK